MQPFDHPVQVTQPLLPAPERYAEWLHEVWDSGRLTNRGALHDRLEETLREQLGVPYLSLLSSGTTALLVALRSLDLAGEVITTPFTFCATTHAIAWSGLSPVFCDVEPVTLNLDPERIEALITPRTSAILAVHAYGTPCDVRAIDAIARRHGLRVIYDAAAAFGAAVDGVPVGRFGDISAFSFHATKLFSTAEGGCLTHAAADLAEPVRSLRNFGIADTDHVARIGLNGKLSELHAAFGLAVLERLDGERELRRQIVATYRRELADLAGLSIVTAAGATSLQYFVIRIEARAFGLSRDELQRGLNRLNVFPRKYFHPLCSQADGYRQLPSAAPRHLPVATRAAEEVLCLPLYGALGSTGAARICEMIRGLRGKPDPR